MSYLYEYPHPIDPDNDIFGNLYEGNNKYAFIVSKQPNLKRAEIKVIKQYIEDVIAKGDAFYTNNVKQYDAKFSEVETEASNLIYHLAKWIFRYMHTSGKAYTSAEKYRAKEIILARDGRLNSNLPDLWIDAIGLPRSVVYYRRSDLESWLKEAIIAKTNQRLRFLSILIGTIILFIVFLYIYNLFQKVFNLEEVQLFIQRSSFQGYAKWIFTTVILVVGIGLFNLKKKQQFFYGVAETAFSLVSGYVLSEHIQDSLARSVSIKTDLLIAAASTIYLIVRGLSNVFEGWNKPFTGKRSLQRLASKISRKSQ